MAQENAIPPWFSGSEHTHHVAQAIAKYGPIARTTLAQMLNLSQGALSRITSDLIYAGVIEELPMPAEFDSHPAISLEPHLPQGFTPKKSSDRRGRPQTALQIRADARTVVGIKIHGNLIMAAAIDAHGDVISSYHERTFEDQSPEHVTTLIAQLVTECADDVMAANLPSPLAIGIAIGGHVTEDSIVTFAPFLHWDEPIDLGRMVWQTTGLPCGVYNDIDSLLVDACWFGPGVGLNMFAIVTFGAGVGYALAANGKPVEYPDKSYGLAGHIPIDPDGPRCPAGHVGCSQCLTDDAIAAQYSHMVGHAVTFEEFAQDARNHRSLATQLVNQTCFRLGTLIAIIANLAMPSKVMIAGESAFIAKLGTDSIRDGINRYRHSQTAPVPFVIANHDWQLWAKAAASQVIVQHIG